LKYSLDEGELFCWGWGLDGCLGLEDRSESNLSDASQGKVLVGFEAPIIKACCGYSSTLALDNQGQIYGLGSNQYGQIGLGSIPNTYSPLKIESLSKEQISDLSSGPFHAAAITAMGSVYMFGSNEHGQLGLGDFDDRQDPALVEALGGKNVEKIWCGGQLTVAITSNFMHVDMGFFGGSRESQPESEVEASSAVSPVLFRESDAHVPRMSFSRSRTPSVSPSLESSQSIRESLSAPVLLSGNLGNPPRKRGVTSLTSREMKQAYLDIISQSKKEKREKERREEFKKRQLQKLREQEEKIVKRTERRHEKEERFWNSVMENWKQMEKSHKLVDKIVTNGILPRMRCKIWELLLDKSSHVDQATYEQLGENVEIAKKERAHEVLSDRSESFRLIELDLERTFPAIAFFQEESLMKGKLQTVLERFCFWKREIGYVQGMSFVVAHLLLYNEPFNAFNVFLGLINRSSLLKSFLMLDREKMNHWFEVFRELFEKTLPDLYKNFIPLELFYDIYLTSWLMTLYTRCLSLEVAGRVWDCFFIFGDLYLLHAAIGILRAFRDQISGQSLEIVSRILQEGPKKLNFETITSYTWSERRILKSLESKVKKKFNPHYLKPYPT